MRRRTPIIIASIIVLIGVGAGLYFLFSSRAPGIDIGNPFDGIDGGPAGPGEAPLPTDVPLTDAGTDIAPRFVKIADGPVVPQTVAFTLEQELATGTSTETLAVTDTEIRFIERASGNVYAYRAHERTLTRLSNRTLPGIQEAAWLADGSMAYVRFLTVNPEGDTVDTYALPADGEGGFFLEKGLDEVRVLGTRLLFTLLGSSTGSTGTVAAAADASSPRTLFTSPLSALNVHLAENRYVAATKAAAAMDGYAFIVSPTSGVFSRVLGPLRGLSVLPSPSGDRVLYSYIDRGSLRLSVLDVANRTATPLPLATLSEKCVWTPDELAIYCGVPRSVSGTLPDDWYQGAVSFADRLWRIDLAARVATLVVDPAEVAELSIDTVSPTLDPAADMLTFTDRVTGALFTYDL